MSQDDICRSPRTEPGTHNFKTLIQWFSNWFLAAKILVQMQSYKGVQKSKTALEGGWWVLKTQNSLEFLDSREARYCEISGASE